MEAEGISTRQLLVLLAVALLAPATGALPRQMAHAAGALSWSVPLLALPAMLLLGWALRRLCGGGGLCQGFERVAGAGLGGLLKLVYLAWGLLLLADHGRQVAARLVGGGYGGAPWLPVGALFALAFYAARGKVCVLARSAEIFYLVLAATLGGVLLLSLPAVEPQNLLPPAGQAVGGVPRALGAVLALLGEVSLGGALGGSVTPRKGDARRVCGWTAGFCVLLAAVQLAVLGSLGAGLAAQLGQPFLALARGVGVSGAFGRVEAAVAAIWTLSDLTLLALTATACRSMAQSLFKIEQRGALSAAVVALGFVGGALVLPPRWLAGGNLVLGILLPIFLAAVSGRRQEHI